MVIFQYFLTYRITAHLFLNILLSEPSKSVWLERSQKVDILDGHEELMATVKKSLLALNDSEKCLTLVQSPNSKTHGDQDAQQIGLKLKVVNCSQRQSTICMHQKNDEVVVNNAPPLPRFPCHNGTMNNATMDNDTMDNDTRTTNGARKKRNIHGTI